MKSKHIFLLNSTLILCSRVPSGCNSTLHHTPSTMTSLEGKVIAITGAGSGIGLATARLLASRGASISVADVRQEPLDAAVADIRTSYPNTKVYAKAVDVRISQEVDDWLDETIKHLGPLNGATNLAGVVGNGKRIVDTQDEDWDRVVNVNVKGVFNCIRAELQRMEKDASIVSTSSVAGMRGYDRGASYSTSKVGVSSPSLAGVNAVTVFR